MDLLETMEFCTRLIKDAPSTIHTLVACERDGGGVGIETQRNDLEAAAEEAKEAEEVDPVEDNLNSKSEALDGQDELAVPEDVEGVRNADGT